MNYSPYKPRPLFHFRLLPLLALALICGILLAVGNLTLRIVGGVLFVFLLLANYPWGERESKYNILLFAVLLVGFCYTVIFGTITDANTMTSTDNVTITCRVEKIVYDDEDNIKYLIGDNLREENNEYGGKIRIFGIYGGAYMGCTVEVEGKLSSQSFFANGDYNYTYFDGERYILSATAYTITEEEKKITWQEQIRYTCRKILVERLGTTKGNIAYSSFFGDTSYIDKGDLEEFRALGVGHLFAVSGLHVGVIGGFIILVLKKCKANAYLTMIITSAVLFLYCFITGGSPSILRATFMMLYGLLAKSLGRRVDFLSAVGFSVLAVLLINPLSLFDISFLLSYGAILGITFLLPVLQRLLRKLPAKIATPLATSTATTLAITPLSIYFFGNLSIIAIPLNLVIIPLFTAFFLCILPEILIGLWIPGFGVITRFMTLVGDFVTGIIKETYYVKGTYFNAEISVLPLILYYLLFLLASEQCLIKPLPKKVLIACGTIIVGVVTILCV